MIARTSYVNVKTRNEKKNEKYMEEDNFPLNFWALGRCEDEKQQD